MNAISNWLCPGSSKNMFVKIVHPGGHVELHDRPIMAAEVLNRNPKSCVAHPNVFQQPHAIISPETTLALGQKYYVVPLGTIRKLQLKYPRQNQETGDRFNQENAAGKENNGERSPSICWLFRNGNKNGERQKIKDRDSESLSDETRTESLRRGDRVISSEEDSSAPRRLPLVSGDNWHPGLESIHEE